MILNPDHDAMDSFVPAFPDGSTVQIVSMPRKQLKWQGGKVVDADGNIVPLADVKRPDATVGPPATQNAE